MPDITTIVLLIILAGLCGTLYWLRRRPGTNHNNNRSRRRKQRKRPPPSQRKRNWLVGKSPDVEGKTYHIGGRTATVGRKVGNFIQIPGKNASRVHCRFYGTSQGCEIEDLDSSNGTSVNDDKIQPRLRRKLEDGDVIEIGDTKFTYRKVGNFEQSHALTERREVGGSQVKKTQDISSLNLDDKFKRVIEEADGDLDEAAQQLGVSRQIFERMLKTTEWGPDETADEETKQSTHSESRPD